MAARIAGHADLEAPPSDPAAQPAPISLEPPPRAVRSAYSWGLANGAVTGNQDFAERYAGSLWSAAADSGRDPYKLGPNMVEIAKALANHLPPQEHFTDYGLALGGGAATPNLMSHYAATGEAPVDAYKTATANPAFGFSIKSGQAPGAPITQADADEHKTWLSKIIPPADYPAPGGSAEDIPDMQAAEQEIALRLGRTIGGASKSFGEQLIDLAEIPGKLMTGQMKGFTPEDATNFAMTFLLPGAAPGESLSSGLRRGPPRIIPENIKEAVVDLKPVMAHVDGEINKLRTNATADRLVMGQTLAKMPPEVKTSAIRKAAYHDIEQRMVDPNHAFAPETKALLSDPGIKSLTDEQLSTGKAIRDLLGQKFHLSSVEEGHVHRIPVGGEQRGEISSVLDPDTTIGDVVSGGGRSLTKFAPGMQRRSGFYMLQNGAERKWGSEPGAPSLEDMGGYGTKHLDPTGTEWTIKPPTSREIEAGTADWQDAKGNSLAIKYHDDFLANLVEDVLRLKRVKRNLEFLQAERADLQNAGIFVPKGTQPNWMVGSPADNGFARVELPGMDGWAHPRIAAILNDFYKAAGGELDSFLRRVNRVLVQSLFVLPVRHGLNASALWAVSRGWEWLRPSGYASLARNGARAVKAVWTMNDDYIQGLRGGQGLQYGNVKTENFHHIMVSKYLQEQMDDEPTWQKYVNSVMGPGYARPRFDKSRIQMVT